MHSSSIPNTLSAIRIIFAFLFPFLNSQYWLALLTLGLATEYLDGALARKFNWASAFGQILDPVADRLLAFSVGVTLVFNHLILPSQLLTVLVRDILVSLGIIISLFFLNSTDIISIFKPNILGKLATLLQYFFYYDVLFFSTPHKEVFWIVALVSFCSGLVYSTKFVFHFIRIRRLTP